MSNRGHYARAGMFAGAAAICLSVLAPRAGVGASVTATLATMAPAAMMAATPTATATPAPTATPVPVTPMPAAPGLAQNAVARFTFSRHFYYLGDTIQGHITLLDPLCASARACYIGTDWTRAGAPAGACRIRAFTCSWKVTTATGPQWVVVHMPISSTIAQTDSDDYYTVVSKGQTVLDGTVADVTGAPISAVTMTIGGPRTVRLPVDPTGYFSAFLPRGRYAVGLDAGSRAADKWFVPRARTVTLRAFATVRFTGYNHTVTTVSRAVAMPTGLDAVTVTVHLLNPFGTPVPGHTVALDTRGAAALLCAAPPNTGRLEPQRVIRRAPLFAPVYQATDPSGSLTYRAYFGTQSGAWTITANDGDVARLSPRTALAASRARVTVRPGAWLGSFPRGFLTRLYAKNGASRRVLSLPQLVLAALDGTTARAPQFTATGFTIPPFGADVAANQRALLRWMATYLPLPGLEIAPVAAGVGSGYGVVIYVHNHLGQGADTRVLDAATVLAIVYGNGPSPTAPAALSTLPRWKALNGGASLGFGGFAAENGLTYGGYPYLPADDPSFNLFENSCVAPAQ